MDYTNYKSKISETVKFHEVDLMGVVNNAVYFSYFEDARMEYLQLLKDNYKLDGVLEQDSFFIMAHNEIDYLLPAEYKDELTVYTKIDWIKNTSICFKHIIFNEKSGKTIAVGAGVMVHIKLSTKEKQNLPQSFVTAIQDFEEGVLKKRD